jgi:branched-chain amino acid aminotransferase
MAFGLHSYPIVYRAKFEHVWSGEYIEKPHKTPAEEARLLPSELDILEASRNVYTDMPLVSYSSQYGFSCFEGLKAFSQKGGGLALFRPDQNAARFYKSMAGLYMPPFPEDEFVKACVETVSRNARMGFAPVYNPQWEKDSFMNADSVYIRPFSYSEGGVGVSVSTNPWVLVVNTPVSAYFSGGSSAAVVTNRIRATPNGTGWIKAASNYVISALAKHEAMEDGFMECIYLDATHRKYVEEGSSCNVFFYLKSGELITPELGDTILPGVTRKSIIELAQDLNVKVSERKISIDEVFEDAAECFVSGTAAGATPIESITHKERTVIFNDRKVGELTACLRDTLKGIQYGARPDTKGWMVKAL